MFECSFELNSKPMSNFKIGIMSFPAFSGLGQNANMRQLACVKGSGPIPPGRYYIVDREHGGHLGWLRDLFNEHGKWFALYADDGVIDDETLCDQVKRGNFRLHPKGPLGRSEGCITINDRSDFDQISSILRSKPPEAIPGSVLKAHGTVTVK